MFTVLGTWLPFWPKWLEAEGCDERQIGWLMTLAIIVRTVATPWLAARADESGRRRRALLLLSLGAAITFLPFALVDGFWSFAGLSVLFGICYPVLIPLVDNLTVLAGHEHGVRYSRVRLWGSMAFLLANVLVGAAVERHGPGLVHGVILAALGAAVLFASWVPESAPRSGDAAPRPATEPARPIRTLLTDRSFLTMLAVAGVLQGSHAAYYSFSTLHWTGHGIGEGTVGMLWAEGVVAEILLFALLPGLVDRLGPRRLFLLGAVAALLRWTVLAASVDVAAIAATNWLHALSFGATHLASIGYLQRHVPRRRSATAQSLLSAVTTGLAMALSTALSGYLFERYGGGVFWAMAGLAAAGAVLAARTITAPTPTPRHAAGEATTP